MTASSPLWRNSPHHLPLHLRRKDRDETWEENNHNDVFEIRPNLFGPIAESSSVEGETHNYPCDGLYLYCSLIHFHCTKNEKQPQVQ